MRFDTNIGGIPAIIEVTHYEPGAPAVIKPDPGDSHPEEPAEIEIRVLDRNGYPAPWLQAKITSQEEDRIYQEALEVMHV